jgi:hypothetical protein
VKLGCLNREEEEDVLFHSKTSGYLVLPSDDWLESKMEKLPGVEEAITSKYRAIGRIILFSLAQGHVIADHVLPPMYRHYLIRGVKPDDKEYLLNDLVHDVSMMFEQYPSTSDEEKNSLDQLLVTIDHLGESEGEALIIDKENKVRKFAVEWFLNNCAKALDALKQGLTLDGKLNMSPPWYESFLCY